MEKASGLRWNLWVTKMKVEDSTLFDWAGAGVPVPHPPDTTTSIVPAPPPTTGESHNPSEGLSMTKTEISPQGSEDEIEIIQKEVAPTAPERIEADEPAPPPKVDKRASQQAIQKTVNLVGGILFRVLDWTPLSDDEEQDLTRAIYNVLPKATQPRVAQILAKAPLADLAITGGSIVYRRMSEPELAEQQRSEEASKKADAIRSRSVPLAKRL